jgi:[acyl-carrier-protein] S-malonyltransferase
MSATRRAILFPGQGAQKLGMAADLAGQFPEVAELFAIVDEVSGRPVADTIKNGPEERLKDTSFSQPALVLADLAAFIAFEKTHGKLEPAALAGLSLGEYAALAAAGAIPYREALRLVSLRGQFMSECAAATPGAMASILGLTAEAVMPCVEAAKSEGVVVAANFNSPKQTVISGEQAAVTKACELCKGAGAKRAIPLNVSGAFHSPLMQLAANKLAPEIEKTDFSEPRFPVIANVTGEAVKDPDEIRKALVAQVTGSVHWVKTLETMQALGATEFLELGPGKVLAGLAKRTLSDVTIHSLGTLEAVQAYEPQD